MTGSASSPVLLVAVGSTWRPSLLCLGLVLFVCPLVPSLHGSKEGFLLPVFGHLHAWSAIEVQFDRSQGWEVRHRVDADAPIHEACAHETGHKDVVGQLMSPHFLPFHAASTLEHYKSFTQPNLRQEPLIINDCMRFGRTMPAARASPPEPGTIPLGSGLVQSGQWSFFFCACARAWGGGVPHNARRSSHALFSGPGSAYMKMVPSPKP